MTKNLEKFIKKSQKVSLTADEKAAIKKAILVRTTPPVRHNKQGSILEFLIKRRQVAMPILVIIALLFAGGVSVAAQKAMPGEVLFPVKVEVNERVQKALTFSAENKAAVELKLATKRLEETESVCSKIEVSADALAKIEANFQQHADAVKARIARFEAEGNVEAAADLSANFQTSLSAHDRILAMLQNDERCVAEVKVLIPRVSTESRAAAGENRKLEAEISTKTSPDVKAAAEGKINAAVNKIAEVQSFIEAKRAEVSAEVIARAEAELAAAGELKAEADASLAAGNFGQAFVEAQQAMQTAQQAKLVLNAETRFQVELKADTSSDSENENATENRENLEAPGFLKFRLGE